MYWEISTKIKKAMYYSGICFTVFNDRYGNHNKSFNNERYKTDNCRLIEELSKEVWAVKYENGTPKISWSTL